MNKHKIIKVVAAIITGTGANAGKVYATQRGYGEFKGGWEFPGGKLEAGETKEQALVREIYEELNVTIKVQQHFAAVEYDYPEFHLSMDCFLCTMEEGTLTLLEHTDAKWLERKELHTVSWLPADQEIVEKLQKGAESPLF